MTKNDVKFGLKYATIHKLLDLFSRYGQIEKVILYGSRAKGNFTRGSDIDLALRAPNLTVSELFKIKTEIDDLLLPYKVDLCLYHTLDSLHLREHIDTIGTEFKI